MSTQTTLVKLPPFFSLWFIIITLNASSIVSFANCEAQSPDFRYQQLHVLLPQINLLKDSDKALQLHLTLLLHLLQNRSVTFKFWGFQGSFWLIVNLFSEFDYTWFGSPGFQIWLRCCVTDSYIFIFFSLIHYGFKSS